MTTSKTPVQPGAGVMPWFVVRVCEAGFVESRLVNDLSHLQSESKATGLRVPVAGFRVEHEDPAHHLPTGFATFSRAAAAARWGSARMDPEVLGLLRRLSKRDPARVAGLVGEWRRAVSALEVGAQ